MCIGVFGCDFLCYWRSIIIICEYDFVLFVFFVLLFILVCWFFVNFCGGDVVVGGGVGELIILFGIFFWNFGGMKFFRIGDSMGILFVIVFDKILFLKINWFKVKFEFKIKVIVLEELLILLNILNFCYFNKFFYLYKFFWGCC